ncbi:MAG: hypothetical protein IJE01_03220 [Clostridia bacterium]|nr:hypothetical protein [Clostridia bacterium]
MKYSIGYQLPDEYFSTLELCNKYVGSVSDVYFAFGSEPSGRFSLCSQNDENIEKIETLQLEELKEVKRLGKTLTLLYNANCYGENATSLQLQRHITKLTGFLKRELDIDNITTTSPVIAKIVKKEFGDSIKIRASVNMRVGSTFAMEQLAENFDGYYLQKEYNRNFEQIKILLKWCKENGKNLHILANSGCMQNCAFQTFHDNLIAHSIGQEGLDNINTGFPAPCHQYLSGIGPLKGITKFMQSNFVRPEEVYLYENLFSEMKLATRMHSRPQMVLAAYVRGSFKGNLLDITEPSYSSLFKGYVLDNTKVSEEWKNNAYYCNKNCETCKVCENAVKNAVFKY